MKFAIYKTTHWVSDDSVIAQKIAQESRGYKQTIKYVVKVIIVTTNDFNINEDFIVIGSEMDSVQYRPKSLHQSEKGYFYKGSDKKRVYLNEKQVEAMDKFIKQVRVEIIKNRL